MFEAILFLIIIGCMLYALPSIMAASFVFLAMVAFIIAMGIELVKKLANAR